MRLLPFFLLFALHCATTPPQTAPRAPYLCTFQNKTYVAQVIDLSAKQFDIKLLWKDSTGAVLGSYERALQWLAQTSRPEPVLLMNAGIFDTDQKPLGLFCADGRELCSYNGREGEGNFYLNPAGIFVIGQDLRPRIVTRAAYEQGALDSVQIRHATQSGPMLVIDGQIHPVFNPQSAHLNIRNGVGVMPDGRMVLLLSKTPVTLHEFATVFKTHFGCTDALYLDGAISKVYCPALNERYTGGQFAGMIAVFGMTNDK